MSDMEYRNGALCVKNLNVSDAETYSVDNPEWVHLHQDSSYNILYGVKKDGDFYFGCKVPSQIKTYVDASINDVNNEIDALKTVFRKAESFTNLSSDDLRLYGQASIDASGYITLGNGHLNAACIPARIQTWRYLTSAVIRCLSTSENDDYSASFSIGKGLYETNTYGAWVTFRNIDSSCVAELYTTVYENGHYCPGLVGRKPLNFKLENDRDYSITLKNYVYHNKTWTVTIGDQYESINSYKLREQWEVFTYNPNLPTYNKNTPYSLGSCVNKENDTRYSYRSLYDRNYSIPDVKWEQIEYNSSYGKYNDNTVYNVDNCVNFDNDVEHSYRSLEKQSNNPPAEYRPYIEFTSDEIYRDDYNIVEYPNFNSFPSTGDNSKIYLDVAENKKYRWFANSYSLLNSRYDIHGYGYPCVTSDSSSAILKCFSWGVQYDYDVKNMKVAIFGHSLVEADSLGTDRVYCFAELLANDLGNKITANFGLGGESVPGLIDVLKYALPIVRNIQYAIICIGANDGDSSVNQITQGLDTIAKMCKQYQVDAIFSTVHPQWNGDQSRFDKFREVNKWIRNSGYLYTDTEQAFLDVDSTDENVTMDNILKDLYLGDHIHPTVEGHRRIYDRIKFDCPYLF